MGSLNIDKILSEMTLEEKALLLSGETFFRTRQLEKYGVPHMQLLDGGTGMNFEQLISDWFGDFVRGSDEYDGEQLDKVSRYFFEPEKLTDAESKLRTVIEEGLKERLGADSIMAPGCYPPGILLGSTWNREIVKNVGIALGMEANMFRIDCLLGTPNVNLLREPRNGRFSEGYSEDPLLAGELGSELVKGVEEQGVAANVKHFAANNLEFNRIGIDQHISHRALQELYLPAFEKCITSGAASVMTSYPSINGVPCTQNSWLLRDILRDEWEFSGINMTDWGACTGKPGDSVNAGVDLFMPGPWPHEDIIEAVKDGRLSETRLNEACRRMLEFISRYSHNVNEYEHIDVDECIRFGDKVNYEAAAEGIVLLRNNGCLPLDDDAKVTLYGARNLRIFGDGSAQVFTSRKSDLISSLGPCCVIGDECDNNTFEKTPDVALVVCSMGSGEGKDRINLKPDDETVRILSNLIARRIAGEQFRIVLVLNVPGPVEIAEYMDYLDAVISVYYPGGEGARALSDIIFGRVNPSGHLTCSWPIRYEDTPAYLCYPDGYKCNYGEGIYVGYRGYHKRGLGTLFPFGWGLSYSSFSITEFSAEYENYSMDNTIKVRYSLRNDGPYDGCQVVQLYASDPVCRVNKPVRELKAFDKVFVKNGETVTREMSIKVTDLASYDDDLMKWIVEDGRYELAIGFDCDNMLARVSVRVIDGAPEYRLGINMTVDELQKYPELRESLVISIREAGEDVIHLIMTERYTPARKIRDVYMNADRFEGFIEACAAYMKE